MEQTAEVKALMGEMWKVLARRTEQNAPDCDNRFALLSGRIGTLTAEMSVPDIMALSASVPFDWAKLRDLRNNASY